MDRAVSIQRTFVLAAVVVYALALATVEVYAAGGVILAPLTFTTGDPLSPLQDLTTFVPILKDVDVPIPSLWGPQG